MEKIDFRAEGKQLAWDYLLVTLGALLCVVSRMEASRLKKIVSECDPHAFVTVCDVHEALGEGFSYHQHTA